MTNAELVIAYNALADQLGVARVTRFASVEVGQRRLASLEAQMPAKQEVVQAEVDKFEAIAEASATIVKGKKVYPLIDNTWHSHNAATKHRPACEVMEMVFQVLLNNREGTTERDEAGTWAYVYLDNAKIAGMHPRIWSGHLRGLSMKGRYRRVKGRSGVFGAILVG